MDPHKVIAAERRRRILALVWDQELSAGEIAAQFDVSWPAISQHLKVLRDAGYVHQRRDGTSLLYRANPPALGHLRVAIEAEWQTSLARLKSAVEGAEQPTDRSRS